MTHSSTDHLKDQLLQATRLLFHTGVMSHSGHGNLSARLPGTEQMLLTGVGTLTQLRAEDLAVVTLEGDVVEGTLPPVAREIVGMHACVYRARPNVGAVIHTHSPHVTSFALAHQPLPCVYEALLRFGIVEDVPVADWAPRGSPEAVRYIVEQLERHPLTPAVLLGNHGLLTFAQDALAAAQLVVAMEESAELTLSARALGGERPFPADALEQERRHMQRFH